MELPKNITQIGEADKHCRIYVEDYVVSYIKQMNGMAQNKDIAIALYGRKTAEDGVAYLFAYGSAKLNFLQKPVRHLSQAQEQEIEKLRRKYFSEMTFLGYQILNGEMVEGFQICEQEICRYVAGYAQFYEKNDSMLAYMLENRGEEAEPEKVDQEKYEVVKKRQEERRQRQESGYASRAAGHTENTSVEYRRAAATRRKEPDNIIPMPTAGLRRMKMAATGVFVLLCVMALALMQQENSAQPAVFVNGALRIEYAAGCAYFHEKELHLTPIEYKLLCLLAQNVGKVLTHTFITQKIWGSSWENDIASLRVFMATLRKKLENGEDHTQYIQTHIGVGYRMLRVE